MDFDKHNSFVELLNPFESDTSNLFRPVLELIGCGDEVDTLAFRTQRGGELLSATSCHAWRLKDSFPIKIISVNEETVLIEILTDFESKTIEARIFPISFFEGFNTMAGTFFKLQVLESKNALQFHVSEASNDLAEHFPYFDFSRISERTIFE